MGGSKAGLGLTFSCGENPALIPASTNPSSAGGLPPAAYVQSMKTALEVGACLRPRAPKTLCISIARARRFDRFPPARASSRTREHATRGARDARARVAATMEFRVLKRNPSVPVASIHSSLFGSFFVPPPPRASYDRRRVPPPSTSSFAGENKGPHKVKKISLETIRAPGYAPPPTKPGVAPLPALTSPRSVHVCMSRGVDPSNLLEKPLSAFAKPGMRPELVKTAHEHHLKTRAAKIDALLEDRAKLPANFKPPEPKKFEPPEAKPGASAIEAAMELLGDEKLMEKHAEQSAKLAKVQAAMAASREKAERLADQARFISHWSPYDGVRVVNAVP